MNNGVKDGDENFLSRWSRRKVDAKVEPDVAEPGEIAAATPLRESSIGGPSTAEMPESPHPERGLASGGNPKAELPPIDSLTHDADFTPFMAKEIDPALRNQAMKKLFADPHYGFDNMDKLDIYIDDYSKSEPIPLDVLKKMYQSKSLFLFVDEEKAANAAAAPGPATSDAVAPADVVIDNAHAAVPPAVDTHTEFVGNSAVSSGTAQHVVPPARSPGR